MSGAVSTACVRMCTRIYTVLVIDLLLQFERHSLPEERRRKIFSPPSTFFLGAQASRATYHRSSTDAAPPQIPMLIESFCLASGLVNIEIWGAGDMHPLLTPATLHAYKFLWGGKIFSSYRWNLCVHTYSYIRMEVQSLLV